MTTTANSATTANAPTFELGVLWVHGIGEHQQGDTVTQLGSPVVEWLEGALRAGPDRAVWGAVDMESARLKQAPSVQEPPANAQLRIRIWEPSAFAKVADQRWLFAEGWWGGQVIEPKVSKFLAWMVTRGPWMLLFHLRQRLIGQPWFRPRSLLGRIAKGIDELLGRGAIAPFLHAVQTLGKVALVLLLWNIGALLVVTLWVAVSLVALVPIGRLRAAVIGAMRSLARVVGDSYVLVRDPTQRAALSSVVLAAANWLRPQCTKLAIVAHSQGAAVACDALNSLQAPRTDLFVTVGAGLVKLHALLDNEAKRPGSFVWAGVVAPVLAASLMVGARLYVQPEPAGYLWLAAVGLLMVGLVAVIVVWESIDKTFSWFGWSRAGLEPQQYGLRWLDFYTVNDPVPNGPIVATAKKVRVRSVPVSVTGSMADDHTGYWDSRADFMPRLIRELARLAGFPREFVPGTPAAMSGLRRNYRSKLPLLAKARWSDWLAVVLPLVAATERATDAVGGLRHSLESLNIESLSKVLGGLDSTFSWAVRTVLGDEPSNPELLTNLALFAALVWLAMKVWRAVFLSVWRWWAELEVVAILTASTSTPQGIWRWLIEQCVGLVGAVPLAIALVWTFTPQYLTEVIAFTGLAVAGGALVVYFIANLSIEAFVTFISLWRDQRQRRSSEQLIESLQQVIAACTIAVAVALGAYTLFSGRSFWSVVGGTCALGVAAAMLAKACVRYAQRLKAWRAGALPFKLAWSMLVVSPLVAAGAAAALAYVWGWLPALVGAALTFSGVVIAAREWDVGAPATTGVPGA